MSEAPQATAGWYDDPELVNTRRYWDGSKWTDHRQEAATGPDASPPVAAAPETRREAISKWEIWGMFAAVFLPPVGLVIGFVLLQQGFTRGGRKIVITAVIVMIIIAVLRLSGGLGSTT